MDQGIRFVITGDTSGLDNATKKAESALDSLNRKIAQLQNEIGQNIKISQGYEKAISDLSNELKKGTISQTQYAKSLSRLQRDEKETTIETNNLRKQLSLLQRDQKSLASSMGGVSQTFTGLNKDVKGTIPAMTSFSQIIQDAPYGIRGVANNIQQLTAQFGHLQKNAGGTGAALRALFSSLAGPAGILLAVSAVTSLLVSYGDEIGNIIKGNDDLAASQKEVNKALNEFYGEQVTKINTYISILEDVNTSETQRKEITDELIKTVPSLTKADFAYGKNLDIVKEKIGQYVLAQAARIEADILTAENSEKLAKLAIVKQKQSIKDQTEREEAFRKFLQEEKVGGLVAFEDTGGRTATAIGGQVVATQREVEKSGAEIAKIFENYANKLEKELAPIQERIQERFGITFGGGADKVDDSKIKSQFESLKEAQSILKKQLEESILTKGRDNTTTRELAKGYKLLTDEINKVSSAFKEPKDNSKKLLESAEKQRAFLIGLENDVNDYRVEKAKETFAAVDAIVAGSINKLVEGYELDPFAGLGAAISNVDKDITNLENKIKDTTKNIQKGLSRIGFDPDQFNIEGLNLEQLELLENQLRTIADVSNFVGDSVQQALGTMVNNLAETLSTGNEYIDAFVGSLLDSFVGMLAQLIAQQIAQSAAQTAISSATAASEAAAGTARAITSGLVAKAQGVQIATSAAAAAGPLGIGLLPAFLAGVQAQILAALAIAKVPSFAQGGIVGGGRFTGDKIPIFVNSGERILTVQDQSFLSNILRGNTAATMAKQAPDMILGEVILRGTTQVVQLRRAEKKMSRFYNS